MAVEPIGGQCTEVLTYTTSSGALNIRQGGPSAKGSGRGSPNICVAHHLFR
jgi:hypothetical protein